MWLIEFGLVVRRLVPCPPMSGTILTEPVIIVQQVWRGGSRPDYDLFDQNWAELGVARRAKPRGWKQIIRAAMPLTGPTPFHVVETNGTLVLDILLTSERGGQVILLRDADGNLIGKGIRTKSGMKPQFDLDIAGQFVGTLEIEDWRQRGGVVRDEAGTEIAQLRTITPDTPYYVEADTDGYFLTIHGPVPDPLRRVVVGCAVVLQAAITTESFDSAFDVTWSLPKKSRAKHRSDS